MRGDPESGRDIREKGKKVVLFSGVDYAFT